MVKHGVLVTGLALVLVVVGGCGVGATATSQGQSTERSANRHHISVQNPSKAPAVSAAELRNIFGNNIPVAPAPLPRVTASTLQESLTVVPIKAEYGVQEVLQPLPQTVVLPVASSQFHWAAYALNIGHNSSIYIPGLVGMQSPKTIVGADGSWDVNLSADQVSIMVSDTPGCVGCAIWATASIFPSSQKSSASYGAAYTGPMVSSLKNLLNVEYVNPHRVLEGFRLSDALEEWRLVDLNNMDRNRLGGLMFMISVVAPAGDSQIATTVLSDVYAQLDGRAKGY
ncbi:MAG: hypothetical protein C7B46_11600 [Sulfobacillus benefaciens]|uniref:Uncharacterized protein n=1 Tax=Sulfobacillus benefaciens TaxID=453960 RepID=A0A2T2XEW8_9FIRM|nr:MAG: hypothetical protein C7B46_11600 [Sulfobacillus benefaciens]